MKNHLKAIAEIEFESVSEEDLLALDDLYQNSGVLEELVMRFQYEYMGLTPGKEPVHCFRKKLADIKRRIQRSLDGASALMSLYALSIIDESDVGEMAGVRALQAAAAKGHTGAIDEIRRLRLDALFRRDFADLADKLDSIDLRRQIIHCGLAPIPWSNIERQDLLEAILGIRDLNADASAWVDIKHHPLRTGLYTLGHKGIIAGVGIFDAEYGAWLSPHSRLQGVDQWRGISSKSGGMDAPDPARLISADLVAAIREDLAKPH